MDFDSFKKKSHVHFELNTFLKYFKVSKQQVSLTSEERHMKTRALMTQHFEAILIGGGGGVKLYCIVTLLSAGKGVNT